IATIAGPPITPGSRLTGTVTATTKPPKSPNRGSIPGAYPAPRRAAPGLIQACFGTPRTFRARLCRLEEEDTENEVAGIFSPKNPADPCCPDCDIPGSITHLDPDSTILIQDRWADLSKVEQILPALRWIARQLLNAEMQIHLPVAAAD